MPLKSKKKYNNLEKEIKKCITKMIDELRS